MWIKDLGSVWKPQIPENIANKLLDIVFGNVFFDLTTKTKETKVKIKM